MTKPYIDTILLTGLNKDADPWTETEVRMKFKDGIAIQVDEDGDVPLFEDPIILTYPSAQDVADSNELAGDIELYTGRSFDVHDPCYFDIAIVFGMSHKLSEIVKR
jgi:hypothetical protein